MITRSKMGGLADLRKINVAVQEKLMTVATNEKIDELITTINEKDRKINELEDCIKEIEKSDNLLEREIDNNESYTNRQNLRITGIPELGDKNETGEGCLEKVKEEIAKLNLLLDSN